MGDNSTIEWTDATWNPIVGCSRVSPGCDNCYAERQTATRLSKVPAYAGLAKDGKWTGELRFLPDRLEQPLRWRRPRRIFVNSMSDLFHDDVLPSWLSYVFAVMAAAPHHTFQVLTKRPQRMARALHAITDPGWDPEADGVPRLDLAIRQLHERGLPIPPDLSYQWPLPNVWLGASIESQRYAFRARHLLAAPAAVRFVSAEPLLGALDLGSYLERGKAWGEYHLPAKGVDWVIVGGESGPGARPMHPDWARSLRDQCQHAGVAFLFKQWGEWTPDRRRPYIRRPIRAIIAPDGSYAAEFTDPEGSWEMWRVGKHEAGRELDGRTWDEYPS